MQLLEAQRLLGESADVGRHHQLSGRPIIGVGTVPARLIASAVPRTSAYLLVGHCRSFLGRPTTPRGDILFARRAGVVRARCHNARWLEQSFGLTFEPMGFKLIYVTAVKMSPGGTQHEHIEEVRWLNSDSPLG